jgi:hypothetical protein
MSNKKKILSCNMTAHSPTLVICEWRGFRRTAGELLPHPSYNTDIAISSDSLIDQVQGQHYATSKVVQATYFVFYEQLKWIYTAKESSDLVGKMH